MDYKLLKRLKSGYSTAAVVLLSNLLFFFVLNAALYGVFYTRDTIARMRQPKPQAEPRPKRPPDDGKLFNSDGSPALTDKRLDYQLDWFDYGAYSPGTFSKEYVAEILDDFYDHSRLGFVFQPWVQFSEAE